MSVESLAANEYRVKELLGEEWSLLIGGNLVAATTGDRFPVVSPYTGEVIAEVPDGGREDVNKAVTEAQAAFPAWSALEAGERAEFVVRLAEAVAERGHDLALLDAIDGGAPVSAMGRDVRMATDRLRYFAGLARELKGQTVPSSVNLHYTERQPYGVVAKIIPFNHPLMFAASKIAAPLVAGNTVVLKPAEVTPLSALLLGRIARDVLPAGVLNIVVGDGPTVPEALVRHPDVHRIGFTGSEATGRAIQRAAAEESVKSITLELGGKNALIAFADSDPKEVATAAVRGMNFTWSGQSCGSTSRLLVHHDIADSVVAELVSKLAHRDYLSPLDPASEQGTIVSERQYERVKDYIALARGEGARVVTGGGPPPGVEQGLFIAPTVLDGVAPHHRVANEEIFGPVLSVLRFSTEDEAVALSNRVRYGLTGSVFTNDLRRAHRVARALETGFVWINEAGPHYTGLPFGGWKNSGVGYEDSFEELLQDTRIKAVTVAM